jgi:hypothetical protein
MYSTAEKVRRQDGSVYIARTLQAGRPRNRGSIPAEGKVIHNVQFDSGVYLVPDQWEPGALSSGIQRPVRDTDQSHPSIHLYTSS